MAAASIPGDDPGTSGDAVAAGGTDAPWLVEPARQQVLTLAADVLGTLPPEDVPPSLRPIARFAPVKRLRLGAVALGAALDRDDEFRDRVAKTLIDTSPDLVEAVRGGHPTAAADPLDVAAVAYLVRPEGWVQALAAANRRWADEQQAGATSGDQLDRLRDEVAELRSRLRTERARVKQAAAEAGAGAAEDLADARRALRERTRELRAIERERDAAVAEVAELRAQATRLAGASETELRRLRARLADAERAAEAARRDARAGRDLDTARLWLLVDTVVQAASGLRRELSLPAPALRPADAVGAGLASAAGDAGAETERRRADDAAALDRLLAMPNVHMIIDGYNVTKSGYGELSLAEQRTRLIGALAPVRAQLGAEITVVFDGGNRPPAQPPVPRGLRVLFSDPGEIADDVIRRLVAAEPAGRPVVVVSTDGEVVRDVGRAGAWTVPSAVLLSRLG